RVAVVHYEPRAERDGSVKLALFDAIRPAHPHPNPRPRQEFPRRRGMDHSLFAGNRQLGSSAALVPGFIVCKSLFCKILWYRPFVRSPGFVFGKTPNECGFRRTKGGGIRMDQWRLSSFATKEMRQGGTRVQ